MEAFEQAEDGRYLLTAEQIGDLQASEFKIGYDSGSLSMWNAKRREALLAKAWDEGYDEGWDSDSGRAGRLANPYRSGSEAETS